MDCSTDSSPMRFALCSKWVWVWFWSLGFGIRERERERERVKVQQTAVLFNTACTVVFVDTIRICCLGFLKIYENKLSRG